MSALLHAVRAALTPDEQQQSHDHRPDATPQPRGQILLLGALAAAIVLIFFVTTLNSVLFTQQLATQPPTVEDRTALDYTDSLQHSTQHVLHTLHTTTSADVSRSAMAATAQTALTDAYGLRAAQHAHFHPQLVEQSPPALTAGLVIAQYNASCQLTAPTTTTPCTREPPVSGLVGTSPNLTGGDLPPPRTPTARPTSAGAPNWTVVTASHLRDIDLQLQRDSLPTVAPADRTDSAALETTFNVGLTDATGQTWQLALYQVNTSTACATVRPTTGSPTRAGCTTSDALHVDLTAGTLDATPSFTLPHGLTAPYELHIQNGDQARGRYSLVTPHPAVSSESTTPHSDFFAGSADASPYTRSGIYAVTTTTHLHSSSVNLTAPLRIAPNEYA